MSHDDKWLSLQSFLIKGKIMTQTDLINLLPSTTQEWEYKPPGYIHFYLRKCNQCPLMVMLAPLVLFTFTSIIPSAKQTFFIKIICKEK